MATPRGAYLIGLAGFAVALVIVPGTGFSACYGFSGTKKTRFGAGGGGTYTFALVQGGLLGASIGIFIIGTTKGE